MKHTTTAISIILTCALVLPSCALQERKTAQSDSQESALFNAPSLITGKNSTSFPSQGERVAANIYVPTGEEPEGGWTAVVVSPPDAGVKEQTAGLYAKKLSQSGYLTIAFDPRGFGESEGRNRGLLDQYGMAEDTQNAVSVVRMLERVNPDRVFILGIASGSATAAMASAFDPRVRGIAMITPHLTDGDELLERAQSVENLRKYVLPQAAHARDRYMQTGEIEYLNMVPETAEELEGIKDTRPLMSQAVEYYLNGGPGDVPNWSNQISAFSLYPVMASSLWHYPQYFDSVPVFLAYGSDSSTGWYATRFYEEIKGPKEILEIEGARHFDLYWKPEYVDQAVRGAMDFFATH